MGTDGMETIPVHMQLSSWSANIQHYSFGEGRDLNGSNCNQCSWPLPTSYDNTQREAVRKAVEK